MATRTPPGLNERRLHVAIIAVAGALAVVMVGAAAWALTRPQPAGAPMPEPAVSVGDTSQGATPSTSAATVPTGSSVPSATVPTGSVTPAPTSGGAPVAATGRRIAFHIGNTLYLAREDASSKTPMHIVGTNYALSPDGRTVAAVEKGKLVVAAVGEHLLASSPSTPGLTAEAVPPVWLPDSSAVLFIRANSEGIARVWRVDRATGLTSEVGPGAGIAVSPNGRTIATMPTEDAAEPLIAVSTSGGTDHSFKVPTGDPMAIALGRDRVFVSTISASGNSALWSLAYDGSKKKQLVGSGVAGGGSGVTYGGLKVSPNGTTLLFAAEGDDGHSRLWTVPVAGGKTTAISGLRDGYALGWSRDSKNILFIEGNAFQGQTTALWRSDTTGRQRKKLVEGATQ